MNISPFGALILVAMLGWLPIVIVFGILASIIAIVLPIAETYKQKLSKVLFWAGIFFLPSDVLFMRYGLYCCEKNRPPNWFYVLYGIAGMLLFFVFSNVLKNKKN